MFDTKREKLETGLSVAILLGIILAFPRPPIAEVDGQRLVVVNGMVVPKWVSIAVLIAGFGVIYGVVWFVGRRLWPVAETGEVERIYEGRNGMTVGWVPDVPGTPSPMEYEPWVPTPDSTAEDFLLADEPNAMRVLLLGMEDADSEHDEFMNSLDRWIAAAPESELRDLIPTAERLAGDPPRPGTGEFLVKRVVLAHLERGIPSREEVTAMVERLESRGMPRYALEGWFDEPAESGPG